ncbi:hypothetical protein WN944_015140 [Citrus x changshan-huyou]|uniref:Uncharacterized protein n=1 Tax=Citrus x changshan-huyou TaxID=2935761 RepID=A0AAP0MB77_9ROSI
MLSRQLALAAYQIYIYIVKKCSAMILSNRWHRFTICLQNPNLLFLFLFYDFGSLLLSLDLDFFFLLFF